MDKKPIKLYNYNFIKELRWLFVHLSFLLFILKLGIDINKNYNYNINILYIEIEILEVYNILKYIISFILKWRG